MYNYNMTCIVMQDLTQNTIEDDKYDNTVLSAETWLLPPRETESEAEEKI